MANLKPQDAIFHNTFESMDFIPDKLPVGSSKSQRTEPNAFIMANLKLQDVIFHNTFESMDFIPDKLPVGLSKS